jgi:hypothetical protein
MACARDLLLPCPLRGGVGGGGLARTDSELPPFPTLPRKAKGFTHLKNRLFFKGLSRHPLWAITSCHIRKRSKTRGGQGERALARIISGRDAMASLPGTANRAPR